MIYVWLCALPISLAMFEMWDEQLRWHTYHQAIHRLFLQRLAGL